MMSPRPKPGGGEALRLLEKPAETRSPRPPWRVLVVDDDPEVHAVTRLALDHFRFAERPLDVLSAASAAAAKAMLQQHDDIALVLLDVVMETEHAGLDVVRYVREELGNKAVRIVLRTGQPGQAPARDVVARYEIDDYRTKTELTFERLNTIVTTALRTYSLVRALDDQRRELLQTNHDLERFAYIASHDLQTPLRGIVGLAQLLQKRVETQLDEDSRSLLHDILRSGRELHSLIFNLLQFSRLGRETVARQAVDLEQVIARAIHRLQILITERNALVRVGEMPIVTGNAVQLEQLFCNLIENGIKFQPGEHPEVEITVQRTDGYWEIRVRDRGIGIEPQYLDMIFEPFRRLHTQDEIPGTGLGLSICYKVAQLHRGTLHAESDSGQGTTMVLRLPIPEVAGS